MTLANAISRCAVWLGSGVLLGMLIGLLGAAQAHAQDSPFPSVTLEANISWDNPTQTVGGDTLEDLQTIRIFYDFDDGLPPYEFSTDITGAPPAEEFRLLVDRDVQAGSIVTIHVALKAVRAGGQESDYSEVVSKTWTIDDQRIPSPPVNIRFSAPPTCSPDRPGYVCVDGVP
jgi:hypothetical protein